MHLFVSSSYPSSDVPCCNVCVHVLQEYHFNYRHELVGCVVPMLTNRHAVIRELVSSTVAHLFRSDVQGDATLEAVRLVAKVVKLRAGRVRPELVDIFLHLPLSQEALKPQAPPKRLGEALPEKKERLPQIQGVAPELVRKRIRKQKKLEERTLQRSVGISICVGVSLGV